MFCSTIIPTIGRKSLARAVESVLQQGYDDGELIVVNDSGKSLPEAAWQHHNRVTLLNTNRRNRSAARNAGAAVAKGQYLHFLDDDDWLLPGTLITLVESTRQSQAKWVHGGFNLVDESGNLLTQILPDEEGNCAMKLLASEWLPLQVSLIEAQIFFELGGFASLPSLLGGYEDIDLSRQISCEHDFACCPIVIANIRVGDQSSTTNYHNLINQNRQSREKQLSHEGSFPRLIHSIKAMPEKRAYWHGQLLYYLLASVRWNLGHRRIMTAVSRTLYGMASLMYAGPILLTKTFWRGATSIYKNRVRSAMETNKLDLYSKTKWLS